MPTESQAGMVCPRRAEVPDTSRLHEQFPGPDRYEPGHGLVSQTLGCTWCGSMPPDDFMAAVRAGAEISPTDKNYKAYIRLSGGEAKFYFQHLDEEQRMEFFEVYRDGALTIGYPGHFTRLPFFIGTAPP